MTNTETLAERMLRLEFKHNTNMPGLEIANPLVDDKTFTLLAKASILSQDLTLKLPPGRYDHCSRGKGWARKGKGSNVEWGDRVKDGYLVGPGFWIVGSSDGFNRKGQTEWQVHAIQVGEMIWTVAN